MDSHFRTVSETYSYLQLAIAVEIPLFLKTSHFDVLNEPRVFIHSVLLQYVLDYSHWLPAALGHPISSCCGYLVSYQS